MKKFPTYLNNAKQHKRHANAILVSRQFANEDDDDDDGTIIEPGNAACAWIQPNGVYTYTHSMVKALGTSLQRHHAWLQC